MSRFSPGVAPTGQPSWTQQLAAALDRRDQRQQMQTDRDRETASQDRAQTVQNIGLANQGIHLTQPGQAPPPFDVNVSGGPDANAILSRAITPALQGRDPLERAANAAMPSAQPDQPLTASLSRNLTMGPGYYVDHDEKAQNTLRDAQAGLGAKLAEALGQARIEDTVNPGQRALKQALTTSEIAKNNADAAKSSRPPEPVSQEHVIDPVTGKVTFFNPKAPPADLQLNRAPKPDAALSTKFQADQTNKILDDYARDTKDFHQVMGGWEVLKGATKDPSLATKFAITDAYARITNPGALVRPTTMEMIDHMGSLGQRMEKAWSQSKDGSLPPEIVQDFQKTLYNIVQEHKKQFDQIRGQAVARGKAANTNVEPYLQNYDLQDPTAPTPRGASSGNVDLGKSAPLVPSYEQWKASKGHP